jgi:hypothetical protein
MPTVEAENNVSRCNWRVSSQAEGAYMILAVLFKIGISENRFLTSLGWDNLPGCCTHTANARAGAHECTRAHKHTHVRARKNARTRRRTHAHAQDSRWRLPNADSCGRTLPRSKRLLISGVRVSVRVCACLCARMCVCPACVCPVCVCPLCVCLCAYVGARARVCVGARARVCVRVGACVSVRARS